MQESSFPTGQQYAVLGGWVSVHTGITVSCPTCHGRGVVPVEFDRDRVARVIAEHSGRAGLSADECLPVADVILQLLESGGRG